MGRVFHHSGDDDMLVVPHSVLGQACLMIQLLQFLDLVAAYVASSSQYQALILNDNSCCQSMDKSPTLQLPNYTLGAAAERGIRQLPSLPLEQKTIGPIHAD